MIFFNSTQKKKLLRILRIYNCYMLHRSSYKKLNWKECKTLYLTPDFYTLNLIV